MKGNELRWAKVAEESESAAEALTLGGQTEGNQEAVKHLRAPVRSTEQGKLRVSQSRSISMVTFGVRSLDLEPENPRRTWGCEASKWSLVLFEKL